MRALARILRAIVRFLVKTALPLFLAAMRLLAKGFARFVEWWVDTFRARSTRGKILFGGGSALAACAMLAYSTAIFSPNAEPTSEPIAAVDDTDATSTEEPPTNTPRPTDTEEPTQTPTAEPSETPQPTDTARPTATATPSHPPGEMATVVGIVDGDTIDVELDGQEYRVRYIGVDTPERGEAFYSQSTEANAELVEGETVVLVQDVSETDQFDRLLRYVYLQDGTFVNAELVGLGFAFAATFPPDVRHQEMFSELQAQAREDGAGLWSIPASGATSTSAPAQATATLAPATATATVAAATATLPPATATQPAAPTATANCDPSYPTVCIAPPPPDLDCGDISARNFAVNAPDPHGFDGDGDGVGCES